MYTKFHIIRQCKELSVSCITSIDHCDSAIDTYNSISPIDNVRVHEDMAIAVSTTVEI